MFIPETKVEIGNKRINARQPVHRRDQVLNQVHGLHSAQVLSQVQSQHNARVLSQVRDLQPAQVTSFNAMPKTEAEEILIITAIDKVVRLHRIEVISHDHNKEALAEEEEEDKTKINIITLERLNCKIQPL